MRFCLTEQKITAHEINNFHGDGTCLSCQEIAESEAVDNAVEKACHPEDVGEAESIERAVEKYCAANLS